MKTKKTDKKNPHSIRISDKDMEIIKEKAKSANLTFSDYMIKKGLEEMITLPPEIICRLEFIKNFLTMPPEAINQTLTDKYKEDVKIICSRLLW